MRFHVLVVEDSPTQAEALRALLQENNYLVTVVSSGEEALEWLSGAEADLVLSDIVMPGITGYELCRRIRMDPAHQEIPVVLVTSLSDPMDIVRGLECGAANYIPKPYDPDQLLARVRRVLDSRSLRRRSKTTIGVNIGFLGSTFTITSDREEILDLLLSSVEDVVRTNHALEQSRRQLADAHAKLEEYATQKTREARASAERYGTLMRNAADAIFVLDSASTILEVNPRAADVLGRPADELIHRSIEEFIAPDKVPDFRRLLSGRTPAPEAARCELRMVRSDGKAVEVDFSSSLTRVDDETLVLAIVRDVTEAKRAEEALRSSEEQLRQAQKMEVVGRLAGGIAHDFNNLLTAMKSNAYFALSDLPEGHAVREDVEEIDRAVDRATSLTHQLLAFSRKQILQPRVVRLSDCVAEMERMLKRLIGENIEMVTSSDPGLGSVEVDPARIEQVILNLALNARDAMPDGGRLTIETRNAEMGEIEEKLYPHLPAGTPAVVLVVRDTGYGIPKEVQERIFEPFFTTKAVGEGTGLGLSTVYGIVKQSGGYIWVESEVGQGTSFEIYFPRVEHVAGVLSPGAAPADTATGSENVLIVEDEAAIRLVVRRALQKQGYSVMEAGNGEEALRILRAYPGEVHLLVTDVVLPGIGGRELARQISLERPGIQILYMSGYSEQMVANRGILEPGVALIEKPFTPESLARRVREILGQPAEETS